MEKDYYMECLKCKDGFFSAADLKSLTGADINTVECLSEESLNTLLNNDGTVVLD